MKRILLIVNPGAGKQDFRDKLVKIKTEFQLYHPEIIFTSKTHTSFHISEYITYNAPFDEIIVLGGDGTLNAVINAIPEYKPSIAFISNGSGNDTIKSIHGVTGFHEQLDIALKGNVDSFDIGKCNNRYFINGVGLGFDGEVVADMLNKPSVLAGHWAYKYFVLKHIAFYRSQSISFNIDGFSSQQPVFSMTIANGSTFGGGFMMNPYAKMNDGNLDIVIINSISIPSRLAWLPKVKNGRHISHQSIHCYKGKTVEIRQTEKIKGHIDGEPIQESSYRFKIIPSAIKFKVPVC